MNIVNTYELPCLDRCKSFYGKAKVKEMEDGSKVLQSYWTDVCMIDKDGNFVRLWDGYSVTTMRHVNSFLDRFGIKGGGKAWWDEQECV